MFVLNPALIKRGAELNASTGPSRKTGKTILETVSIVHSEGKPDPPQELESSLHTPKDSQANDHELIQRFVLCVNACLHKNTKITLLCRLYAGKGFIGGGSY